jgi:integrase
MASMSAKIWNRGERGYWARIYAKGTTTAEGPFGDGDEGKRLAQEFCDGVNAAQSAIGRWGQWRPGLPIPVDQLVRDWERIHGPLRSERTQCTDHARVERLAEWFGPMDARSLHESVCRAFAVETMEDRSAAVAVGCLSILRRVLNLAVKAGGLDQNPVPEISEIIMDCEDRDAEEVQTADAWDHGEAAILLNVAESEEPHFYPPLQFALATGARRGEIITVRWEDVDWARKRIHFKRTARFRRGTKVLKGRRRRDGGRFTPVSDELLAVLKEQLKKQRRAMLQGRGEPEWVFPSPKGHFWMERNFSRMWERVRRKALPKGARPLKFHCTRHTFITWALEAGTPVTRIAEWVGASVKVIEDTYRHVMPQDAADLSFTNVDRTKTEPDRTKLGRSGGSHTRK